MASTISASPIRPNDFLNLDALLCDEERAIRDTVRRFVAERVTPLVGDGCEEARIPRELAPELGRLGLLWSGCRGWRPARRSAASG